MRNIEVEVRSFISPIQYRDLGKKLTKITKFLKEGREETVYYGKENLRIRRDGNHAYLILKLGKIHDDFRNEIKIRFARKDFEKLRELFEKLDFKVKARWLRKRKVYNWKGTKVFLDDTKGYGKIIELEEMGKEGKGKIIYRRLKEKLESLGVKITSKKVFDQKFKYYKKNWKKILKIK